MRRWHRCSGAACAAGAGAAGRRAGLSERPIRAIASQGPGGLSDVWMRAVADQLGPVLGGGVVVEDRAGAAGTIGARACAEAAPDGYTFCILPTEAMVINPLIYPNTGFDPKKSLAPVTKAFYPAQVFAVNALAQRQDRSTSLPRYAKAKPKTLNYMAPSLSKVGVHGGVQQEARHRHRPRAVQGRRRRGQQHDDRHDADRDLRHRQPDPVHPQRQDRRARRRRRQALAARPRHPDVQGDRLHQQHLPATFFGVYAPAGTPKPIIDKFQQGDRQGRLRIRNSRRST